MLRLLRDRDLALLFAGQATSALGDHFLLLALPFHVLDRTGSVLAAGGFLAASAIPRATLGPLGGLIADRYPHRRVLIALDTTSACVVLLLLTAHERLWVVYVVAFLGSAVAQVFGPTKTTLTPNLVRPDQLIQANSLLSMSDAVTRLAGPAIGGAIFASFGLTTVIVLDAATFLVSGSLIALMRTSSRSHDTPGGRFLAGLREGLDVIRGHPIARSLLVVAAVIGLGSGAVSALLVAYVRDVLAGGPQTLGLLASTQGVGTVIGAVLTPRLSRRFRPVHLIAIAGICSGAGTIVLSRTGAVSIAAGIVLAIGVPATAGMIAAQTILQTTVDRRYLGRVAGAFATSIGTATIIGLIIGGVLGDRLGTPTVLALAGAVHVVGGLTAAVLLRERIPARNRTREDLRRTPPFEGCSPLELEIIRRAGDVITVPNGAQVDVFHDRPRFVYFVLEGELRGSDSGLAGVLYGPGAVIGLNDGRGSHERRDVVANTASTIFVVDSRRIKGLVTRCPNFAFNVIRELAGAMVVTDDAQRFLRDRAGAARLRGTRRDARSVCLRPDRDGPAP